MLDVIDSEKDKKGKKKERTTEEEERKIHHCVGRKGKLLSFIPS
jgi:hypothetical protein